MSRYQMTVRTPNGKGWRIRTTSAAEFTEISREIIHHAAEKLHMPDLQSLWPEQTLANWHAFAADTFEAVLHSVSQAIRGGQFDVLKTGANVFEQTVSLLRQRWSTVEWTDIAKRLVKILLSLAVTFLRTQFPAINAANSGKALAAFQLLVSSRV